MIFLDLRAFFLLFTWWFSLFYAHPSANPSNLEIFVEHLKSSLIFFNFLDNKSLLFLLNNSLFKISIDKNPHGGFFFLFQVGTLDKDKNNLFFCRIASIFILGEIISFWRFLIWKNWAVDTLSLNLWSYWSDKLLLPHLLIYTELPCVKFTTTKIVQSSGDGVHYLLHIF